jgi:hypothetical protein
MSTKRSEQETVIRFAGTEDFVSIFTAHIPTARKLERFGYEPWKVTTRDGQPNGWFFRVPISEFSWRVGKKKKRTLTEAQAQAGAERLARARLAARLAPVPTANSNGNGTDLPGGQS